ncbi:hypothetical protein BKA70DRAFT_1252721 [Coprinopsis sp. MPI-PUGE-AT-0042]|nr:hypothetical protein BKA70DRAFT_1252721 [Coprinopsis sp. MPI-PUGE-AT-0042]
MNTQLERDAIDSRISELEEEIRKLRSKRNALIPVSKLPPEILAKIFLLRAEDPGTRSKTPHWAAVSYVSQQWRSVALGFPRLWSRISSFQSPSWAEAFLARSEVSSREVDLHTDHLDESPALLKHAQRAITEVDRLRCLSVRGLVPALRGTITGLASPAPVLEELALFQDGPSVEILPEHFLAGHTPRLDKLSLMGWSLHSWSSPLLSANITVLFMTKFRSQLVTTPPRSGLLDALSVLPNLTWLRLDIPLCHPPGAADDNRRIYFPRLTTLHVGMGIVDATFLLQHIAVPLTVDVDVWVKGDNPDDPVGDLQQLASAYVASCFEDVPPGTLAGVLDHSVALNIQPPELLYIHNQSTMLTIKTSFTNVDRGAQDALKRSFVVSGISILVSLPLLRHLPLHKLRTLHLQSEGWPTGIMSDGGEDCLAPLRKLKALENLALQSTPSFFMQHTDQSDTYPALKNILIIETDFRYDDELSYLLSSLSKMQKAGCPIERLELEACVITPEQTSRIEGVCGPGVNVVAW